MTDDKLTAARRALAQIADLVTQAFFDVGHAREAAVFKTSTIYGNALVQIREIAQDAAEATLDKVETRT